MNRGKVEVNEQYRNKEWLKDRYIKDRLSDPEIGKLCRVYQGTIGRWRKKFNIVARLRAEVSHLAKGNHCNLSQEAIDWINGELLGDGCLGSKSPNYSAQVHYGSKYLDYINYVRGKLKSFGILQMGNTSKTTVEKMNCSYYSYSSLCYEELLLLRKKWYPNNKKIIPRDLELTPVTIRQWYIGDGCLNRPKRKGSKPYITLLTCGFPTSDVLWLVKELIKLSFKTTWQKHNNSIYISTKSVKDFLTYIGPCPVERYQSKWNLNKKGG